MAAVRHSFAVPAAVGPLASPPGTSEEEETTSWAPQDGGARPRPPLRVRRPSAAAAATAAQAPAPQQATAPQQPAAPPPFMFGTPGAGPTGSATKARRAKGRSPAGAAAPSPAFTTSSAASMAWSPYPSSTDGASAATPQPPGSATPTSGAASAAAAAGSVSPADSVAADLRARLNLESKGGPAAQPAGTQGEPRPAAGQQTAAPPPPAPEAPFSFVFGSAAAAPSAHAGRAAFRRHSPSSSPGTAKASPRAFASASAAGGAAAPAAASQFGAQSSAASEGSTAAGPASPAAGPSSSSAAAGPEQQPAGGSFVFGAVAAAGSPAARVRPRSRSHSVSPKQPVHASGWGAAGAAAAAAAAAMPATMPAAPAPSGAGAAAFERMQENHQQQAQQSAAAPQQGVFAPKQPAAASPPAFAAAGTAARRPPGSRRKAAHPARSSTGMGTRSRQGSQEAEAAAPPAVAVAPAQGEAAAAPAAGSGELDAKAKMAYTTSEMYRSQGNEAFRDSDYSAAYDLYTKALHALWPYPPLHPRLALLLSNRAAALLSQGKPLSALADCQMGLKYDPGLMRCALRVATCHSRMGNFDEAFQFVAKLRTAAAGNAEQLREIESKQRDLEEQERQLYEALRSLGHNLSPPRRDPATGAEAEPLSRAPSGASMHRAASGASMSRASSTASVAGGAAPQAPATAEAFWDALKKVDDIAPHVPHAELLLAAKAEGLLRLGKHERAREFCGQAVHLDEGPHREEQKRAPWRLWVQAQCSWQEGDARGGLKAQLQAVLAALEAQQAQQEGASAPTASAPATAAGSAFFPTPASAGGSSSVAARQEARRAEQLGVIVGVPSCQDVRSLLEGLEAADRLRLAGNAAVKAGKAAEAVAKYSEALLASGLSPAIMAVLLSNRAAAHQHLKQRAQAIADCCRAIALNPHYAKAHSRLATLLSELGYHSDAASALEAAAAAPGLPSADRKEYQSRMSTEQAAAKRAGSRRGLGSGSQAALDHYKLLGLERSVTSDEVRRTYKKLALQLHPDKAASAVRLAPKCAGCGSAPFEALAAQDRLQERATWLFKLLGEANDVLSDASKRRELDHALRTAAGGSSAGRGGFSSYYGDSDDDISEMFNSFGNMFGRRAGGATGGGFGGSGRAGGYGYGGAGFGSYGGYGQRGAGGSGGAGAYNRGYGFY